MTESIPKGYQKTEIGIIPDDWEVTELKRLVSFKNGIAHENIITQFGKYIVVNSKFVSTSGEIKKYSSSLLCPVLKDDILMVMSDVPNGKAIAKCFIVDADNKYTLNQRICSLTAFKDYDSKFLFYKLNRNKYFLSFDDGAKQTNLRKEEVLNCLIDLPKDPIEQSLIAQVLSNTDELIESLTKLIEKKKNIKQGAMQELLIGKKRLPGFTGEWEEKEFNKVAWFQEGPGLRNWQFTKSGIKVINVTNLENGYLNLDRTDRHISLEEFKRMYLHFEINENDIVVASSGNSYAKVSLVRKKDLPLLMNTSVIRFKPLNNITFDFLFAFLKSPLFKNQIDLLITGGAQPNFGPYHLKKLKINMPLDKKEQSAIAQILSDMDSEIESLEAKRDKYINLKQGMMQELLTGRIRLKCQK